MNVYILSEFGDNGVTPGELREMTSQADVRGVERCEEGGGRVGQDAMVKQSICSKRRCVPLPAGDWCRDKPHDSIGGKRA